MARQAKCVRCEIRFVWDRKLCPEDADPEVKRLLRSRPTQMTKKTKLAMAACPFCGFPLWHTNSRCPYPVRAELPLNVFDARARALRGSTSNPYAGGSPK